MDQTEQSSAAHGEARPRVLAVDDDLFMRRAVGTCLAREFELTLLAHGGEAIDLLHGGAEFDAVLLDLLMPEVGGRDVLRWIQTHRPDLVERTGFVTGGSSCPDDDRFLATVNRPVLFKPFSAEQLVGFACELACVIDGQALR